MQCSPEMYLAVADLIHREATCLDRRRWEEWLSLYTEDCIYWVPSWKNEEQTVEDPEVSLNMMFLKTRASLADRIFRIETEDSFASVPLDRTSHVVGTLMVNEVGEQSVEASANFVIHTFGIHGSYTRGGFYDYTLRREGGELKIARKKITLINDRLETAVDVYSL